MNKVYTAATEIIIIEDNNLFRKTLADFINQCGELRCRYSYTSMEDALRGISEEGIDPDLIFLDVGLPGMSGVDGISYLKKLAPHSKIIILTIRDDDETIFNAVCKGASGYLLKDSSSERIIDSVKEVMNGGVPVNAAIAAKICKMFREFVPEQKDYNLTRREKEILRHLVDGLSKKQIAEKLFLSYHTIDSHIRNIYEKLEVHSGSRAVAKAIKEKLI